MKSTTKYLGRREAILHASTIKEAELVFGSLAGFPAAYINRCKSALKRCQARLTKVVAKPAPKAVEAVTVVPDNDSDHDYEPSRKSRKYNHGKNK